MSDPLTADEIKCPKCGHNRFIIDIDDNYWCRACRTYTPVFQKCGIWDVMSHVYIAEFFAGLVR